MRVTPASSTFDGSESILFTGQVYDESLRPVSDADVTLDLIAEDGRSFPYIMQSGPEGHYRLRLESLPEGLYEYRAQAVRLGEILGSDRGSFTVAPLGLEYRDLSADTGLLRQIALRSGGHYFTPETLGTLPAVLAQDSTFMPQISTETVERELWQWPAIAILILILLSIEWVLRKRSGLV
ncbi:MAG: carboxypeptidase-like regulatory domain-containing protein [Bacteroidota bacterium]|nr:carboxypeptidase-like regulatory domain-containing protein [Bacteroidota bacterium]